MVPFLFIKSEDFVTGWLGAKKMSIFYDIINKGDIFLMFQPKLKCQAVK